jgi:hypothetical protein
LLEKLSALGDELYDDLRIDTERNTYLTMRVVAIYLTPPRKNNIIFQHGRSTNIATETMAATEGYPLLCLENPLLGN